VQASYAHADRPFYKTAAACAWHYARIQSGARDVLVESIGSLYKGVRQGALRVVDRLSARCDKLCDFPLPKA
jgi:hypothetical protein